MRPNNEGHMTVLLLSVLRFVRLLLSGHQAVAIENAALRLQLAAFRRKRKRPVLTSFDRLFWVGLSGVWRNWRSPLLYVQADTVARWQRERFRKFWARLSRGNRRHRGRPATAVEIRRLIERVVASNPLWRAPRIHGELPDAWHRDLGANRLANPPKAAAATQPDLEDVSSQPPRPNGFHRFLYGTDRHHEGAVRVPRAGTPPSASAAFQRDRASHRRLDLPADRRGLRRSGCAEVSHSRSGSHLRQRGPSADRVTGH